MKGVLESEILTATQLWVECDSRERLDAVQQLAATFGFSQHFRGETYTPPPRQLNESELAVVMAPDSMKIPGVHFVKEFLIENSRKGAEQRCWM